MSRLSQSFRHAVLLAIGGSLSMTVTHCVSQYDILGASAGMAGSSTGGAGSGGLPAGNTGGASTTGGSVSSGGASVTGGASTTGGSVSSGGSATGGALGSGGFSGSGGSGGLSTWTAATCDQALSQGLDRDACSGDFSCESALRDCCKWTARCSLGMLAVVSECSGCACRDDTECPAQEWCVDGKCIQCPPPVPCRPPLIPLLRKNCPWCITNSVCHSDQECASPAQACYAGEPCLPGCEENSSCCHGSICADRGCGPTTGLDCSVVGCPDGFWCDMVDGPATCACVNSKWLCSPGSRNTCRPF